MAISTVLCLVWASLVLVVTVVKIPYYYHDLPATNVTYDAAKCAGVDVNNSVSELSIWCHGMETGVYLRGFGFRGAKLRYDPQLFLGPHSAMGCFLFVAWVLLLVGAMKPSWRLPTMRQLAFVYFPVLFVFSVHTIPAAHGLPGYEINVFIITVEVFCAIVGMVALWLESSRVVWWAWAVSMFVTSFAPVGDLAATMLRAKGTSEPINVPHPDSGHGPYASCGCGWLGATFVAGVALVVVIYLVFLVVRCHNPDSRFSELQEREGTGDVELELELEMESELETQEEKQ